MKNELTSLVRIRNGDKAVATFSAQEYDARQEKLRRFMRKKETENILPVREIATKRDIMKLENRMLRWIIPTQLAGADIVLTGVYFLISILT